MKIASYLPLTLCDYPGKIAAMAFTQGCGFRCPWCHNKHLIPAEDESGAPSLSAADFLPEVAARCRAGTLDGLVISGGEPTFQTDLPDFLRECKALGVPVKLDTNGSNPRVLRECFAEGLVAFAAMDVKAPPWKYSVLCGRAVDIEDVRASIKAIAESGLPRQFRTTLVPGILDDGDIEGIRAMLPPGETLVLQEFRPCG